MLPSAELLSEEITPRQYYNKTYNINYRSNDTDVERQITGYIDDLEAIKQAVYLILSTERYAYPIYSWDYGVELVDLYGKPINYVIAELPQRITEALTQDNRIETVTDFEFERNGSKLHTSFVVVTTAGNIETDLEVVI